jgi:outer membrane protein assembly factor BamA
MEMSLLRHRIFISSASGVLAYPFSMTRRLEMGMGFTRYSFDLEGEVYVYDLYGRLIDRRREALDTYDPLNMFQASVALVGDYSFNAYTSPVRGGRYRFGVEGTMGTVDFFSLTADYRRYFNPFPALTVAFRGLHFGRYGKEAEQNEVLQPFFLGYETLIRGYSYESFDGTECTQTLNSSCAEWDRLFGHRLAVANFELRVPFIGSEQFGIVDLPYIPMEVVAFADVGLAWDSENSPVLEFSRVTPDRVPVMSSGVSARFNLLGFMILEAYYAYPFQRPGKGWHWGFSLAPGW